MAMFRQTGQGIAWPIAQPAAEKAAAVASKMAHSLCTAQAASLVKMMAQLKPFRATYIFHDTK